MDQMNFCDSKFWGLGFAYLELLISGGLRPEKEPFRSIRLPSVSLVCRKFRHLSRIFTIA